MMKKIFGDFKISLPVFILLLGLGFFIGVLIPLNIEAYPICQELSECLGYWWTNCTQYNYDECCNCCEYGYGHCELPYPICENHVRYEHTNACAQTCDYHEESSSIIYCGTECEGTISGTTCTYPAGSICENATCGSCNYHTCDVCDLCSGYKSPSPEAGCVSGTGCFIPSGSSCQCVKDVCGAECAKDSDCPTGKECDTSTCTCITPCECTSTTVGGCCDGCNYCPAGKVFNGTSCVDATATVKCASTVNKCTAGNCSGEKRYPECQAGGTCDSSATTYYTSDPVYASAGKVLTSSCTNQNATSSVKCASTVNKCTAGNCSGEKRYPECQSGGVCDSSATTYYTSDPVDASAGCSLTSSCGNQCNSTIESQLCDSTWRASSGIGDNNYGKGGDYNCQGMCDGSGLCEYAVNCTGCDCTSWANQSCGYPSCDSYHMGQTRTCTPSGCDTEFRCICSESCCTSWSNQGCGAGGCAATEMYQIRTCGSDCSYSTSQCVSDPSCGGVITINPPQVTTVAATNVTQTSATLNGYLDSLGYDPGTCPSCSCIVWFKWKLSTATTWNETTPVSMATEGPFSANISGLTSNTTYYFEAFAKNGGSW